MGQTKNRFTGPGTLRHAVPGCGAGYSLTAQSDFFLRPRTEWRTDLDQISRHLAIPRLAAATASPGDESACFPQGIPDSTILQGHSAYAPSRDQTCQRFPYLLTSGMSDRAPITPPHIYALKRIRRIGMPGEIIIDLSSQALQFVTLGHRSARRIGPVRSTSALLNNIRRRQRGCPS